MNKIFTPLLTLIILWGAGLAACAHTPTGSTIDFIENHRQFPDQVLYKAFVPGGALFLTGKGFTYTYYNVADLDRIHDKRHEGGDVSQEPVRFHAYQVNFLGADEQALSQPETKRSYHHNYFLGNDPARWAGDVPLYGKVTRKQVYKGIDAVVYSKGSAVKYDFMVDAGIDPSVIRLQFEGVTPRLQRNGSLLLQTSVNTVTEQAPYAYQVIGDKEVKVPCRYKLSSDAVVSFELPSGYNKHYPLVIDPVLVFSTFSGGSAMTYGFSATYDTAGSLYAGGECFGVGWPVTTGAYQVNFGNGVDAGVNKYSPNGNILVYSTYYGGSGQDLPTNMIVNNQGELVICGSTSSTNLPVPTGCYDNTYNGGSADIFIARFSVSGSNLLAATYIGGSSAEGQNVGSLSPNYGDASRGEVLTDSVGNIYIAASSSSGNFPVTSSAFQGTLGGWQDGVICKFNAGLSNLLYSTFLGGSSDDACFSLVFNSSGEVVVCGGTMSPNFPTTSGTVHPAFQGGLADGFVSILNLGTGLVHSTYLGTNQYDHAFKVQIDPANDIYVCGQTAGNYPVSSGVYSITGGDIFIDKLSPNLSSSMLSTRLGNTTGTKFVPTAFLHDNCGNTYLCGFRAGNTLPVTPNAFQSAPVYGFWLGALGPGFTNLLYGTYIGTSGDHVDGGSSRFDPKGIIYHSVCTNSAAFPTTTGSWAPVKLNGTYDIASFKFNTDVSAIDAAFALANNASDTGCAPYSLQFTNLSTGSSSYLWDFGDGTPGSTLAEPSHTFEAGAHLVKLIAYAPLGCALADTAEMMIYVKPGNKPRLILNDTFICAAAPLQLTAQVSNVSTAMGFHWEPVAAILSNPNLPTVSVNPAASNTFMVYISNAATGECVDTAMGTAHIRIHDNNGMYALPGDTTICPGDTVLMRAFGGRHYTWSPLFTIDNIHNATARAWPETDRQYKVLIEGDSGCTIERAVNIRLVPPMQLDAGPDLDVKYGESITIQASSNNPVSWTPASEVHPANGINPVVSPAKTTTYYVTAITPEGCIVTDSVTIHVTNAVLPNAFTPNGDGVNDYFQLLPVDDRVKLREMSIYNRFGQRVFFTRNIAEQWDGTHNGKPADLDTYYYYAEYKIGERTYKLKGDVTLLR
ncbi:gliding motility-associated C-terminal domain-containing protein [Taibaiella chishuiensis]|uniref:Gliding motility-associated-like protein n=1 Tax=Taibaiella chishuiensis TaxID=1434707 RepID=A0A2P8CYE7_9BACT|nr:gliding motility-associated C-terminal domain-containing protein [Taibaiella chishuiensis]PSK90002.1 gliding motility-associated-like protein [Taibaiella chishuiensis]